MQPRTIASLCAATLLWTCPAWAAETATDQPDDKASPLLGAVSNLTPGPPPPVTDGAFEYFSLQVENDVFTGTDRHYTNGIRASWLSAEAQTPDWLLNGAAHLPFFPLGGVKRWGIAAGHSLFTPANTQKVTADPNDRPYSGWLYGSVGLVSDTGSQLDNLELTLGVVGPSAHGETVQNDWHRLIGVETAKGWDSNRLHDEPGFIVTYERKWRALQSYTLGGLGADVTPHVGASLGNVMTYAAAGATVRIGFDLPQDYGPPRIRPSLPGTTFFVPSSQVGWYLFGGIEGRAVARNIFLDGNTFRDSPSVDKLPFVGDAQAGLAVTVGDWRLAYTQVWRSREFRKQGEPDTFGSLSATVRF